MPPEAEELVAEVERLRARLRALEGEHRAGDAEEALRRSEARLAACIQITPHVAIQWYDAAGRVVFWNHASERVFGFSAEEARGKTLAELIHTPAEAEEFRALLQQVRAEGRPFGPAEFPFRRRDGSTGQCISTVFEIPAPVGEACFVCMDVDISERKRAEEALRRSEERLRRLLDLLPDAVWLMREERIEWANRACLRLLGAERAEQVVGRFPDELFPCPAGRELRAARDQGPVEVRLVRPDGAALDVEVSAAPADPEGKSTQVVLRDVTARKRMEEALRHSQKMEAVGRLAGGVAHDFNNLLTAIQATCEALLRTTPPGAPGRPLLFEIRQAGERAAALTGQLLAFSRKQLVSPRVLDPNQVIRDLAGILRRLIGEDVELALELDPRAGAVRVDPAQLEQVLLNLALNGRDAMPQGGTLTIATRPGTPGPGGRATVEVEVQDGGVGMDEATRQRLFEPFFTTKELGKGTGLGLATVYAIVEQCGGEIRVDTAPGRGTRMTLRLPRSDEVPTRSLPSEGTGPPRGSETVLVVEDDPLVRRVTARALRELGYQVLEAVDGEEALEVARGDGRAVDLLLTDVVMPRLSGRELARRLQAESPRVKVLFASGYTDDTVLRHGIQAEELDFLAKPFTVEGLARKVRELLDRPPG